MSLLSIANLQLLGSFISGDRALANCGSPLEFIRTESTDTPFYEHYHQLLVPVAALVSPPSKGLVISTSAVDAESYNQDEFSKFLASSGLKRSTLQEHKHDVLISHSQLLQIRDGAEVEIRVISKAGNYVHNFFIKASPSALSAVKRKAIK